MSTQKRIADLTARVDDIGRSLLRVGAERDAALNRVAELELALTAIRDYRDEENEWDGNMIITKDFRDYQPWHVTMRQALIKLIAGKTMSVMLNVGIKPIPGSLPRMSGQLWSENHSLYCENCNFAPNNDLDQNYTVILFQWPLPSKPKTQDKLST